MSASAMVRSISVGVAAALVVVGAYAWGRGHPAAAAPTGSLDGSPAPTTGASPMPSGQGISVSGTGRVTGTPSVLRLQTTISVVKPDVSTAMQTANETMAKVQKTLRDDGVAAADLQTSGLSVAPNYDYSGGGSHLTGYRVSENLAVVLRDLGKAGSIISDVAATGGDALQIGAATLDLDHDNALVAQARQNAFADAKAKAQAYALAAGRTLGAVTSITESEAASGPQTFNYPMAAASSAAAAPVPIQAGSQDVTVTVAVTWALN